MRLGLSLKSPGAKKKRNFWGTIRTADKLIRLRRGDKVNLPALKPAKGKYVSPPRPLKTVSLTGFTTAP